MYGVVEIKGHQYRVSAGDVIDVEKMEAELEANVKFDQVLFIGGASPIVGMPVVQGATITAKVVRQDRDRKVIVFKRSPGSWRRRKGHRQSFTCLVITEVNDGKGNVTKIDVASKTATKFNIK